MLNLEWLRTFRAVYRTKSLSRASELLNISQPTVSQQLSTLESHLGQKLFTRKSKGVIETDEGRLLNTLVSGAIESLEEVESEISRKKSRLKTIITIGISHHLYKTLLCKQVLTLSDYVHIKFGTKQELVMDVEEGRLLYAIIPDELNTFDINCYPLGDNELVLVSTPDIELNLPAKFKKEDLGSIEKMLAKQVWFAHDTSSSYIKLFWITLFNKKRPAVIPNYVIPNEYEALIQLSESSGVSIALKSIASEFVKSGKLKIWKTDPVYFRKLSLIANKKNGEQEFVDKMLKMLRSRK